ncbi:MAG: NAD(P)/FAD-dependent oxidoreductase [Anaerolineae bacterium]|jgi:glycerol-3-phosphate dehydrogenase|nr:NAD(P)/FAD-dependent oxidoreductase [Chloroflexota bacterium]
MPDATYDVIIVGAGVVGAHIARQLSRYRLRTLLLDKAADVGDGTTKANTAIVHAGYDARPGSKKALFNVAGNAMFDQVCAELDVEFDRCGTYVVATSETDLATLQDLASRGRANGVTGLELISGEEMRRREPGLTEAATGALYAPTGGIVDPFALCFAAAENAVSNGVELALNTTVSRLLLEGNRVVGVDTNRGMFRSRWTIIAAGLHADDLMRTAGLEGLVIRPRKGEYFVLDRAARSQLRNVLFPCPTPVSKGIMVTPTIHGNILLGPTANDVDDKEDLGTTAAGLNETLTGALKLIPGLDPRLMIRSFTGLRATGSTGDFEISTPAERPGLLVLAGIESPGLTASPAIALHVVDMLREAGLTLQERPEYVPTRKGIPRFSLMTTAEQEALIAQDARYGRVVCRCETVTEGEVVAACHSPIPARTYDALKRRTRIGTGRCQGGFDLPLVLEIMAREYNVSPLEITQKGGASALVFRRTKEVGL